MKYEAGFVKRLQNFKSKKNFKNKKFSNPKKIFKL